MTGKVGRRGRGGNFLWENSFFAFFILPDIHTKHSQEYSDSDDEGPPGLSRMPVYNSDDDSSIDIGAAEDTEPKLEDDSDSDDEVSWTKME
jgi:hypothetical protein